jgi:hypothetical protein
VFGRGAGEGTVTVVPLRSSKHTEQNTGRSDDACIGLADRNFQRLNYAKYFNFFGLLY